MIDGGKDTVTCSDDHIAPAASSASSATSALSGFDFEFVFLSVSAPLR